LVADVLRSPGKKVHLPIIQFYNTICFEKDSALGLRGSKVGPSKLGGSRLYSWGGNVNRRKEQ